MSSWKCLRGVLDLVISAFRISLGMMIPNTNEEWKYNICVKQHKSGYIKRICGRSLNVVNALTFLFLIFRYSARRDINSIMCLDQ